MNDSNIKSHFGFKLLEGLSVPCVDNYMMYFQFLQSTIVFYNALLDWLVLRDLYTEDISMYA